MKNITVTGPPPRRERGLSHDDVVQEALSLFIEGDPRRLELKRPWGPPATLSQAGHGHGCWYGVGRESPATDVR